MGIDTGVYYSIKNVMDKYDIPSWIWQPIAELESGFNPLATNITDREYSLGIFQINVAAHPEFASYNLYDPAENAEAIAKLWGSRGVIDKAKELPAEQQAAYVWRYGSRPAWTPELESKVTDLSKDVITSILGTDNTDYSKYLHVIYDDLEKIGLAKPDATEEKVNLSMKHIIIRGVAYGLVFIGIFIALMNMLKPDFLPDEIAKAVKKIGK